MTPPDEAPTLSNDTVRTDLLNRLRRAEGQLRGIQRMIEAGDDCTKVAMPFAAARRALDSTYDRMIVCRLAQSLESHLPVGRERARTLEEVVGELGTLLARRG